MTGSKPSRLPLHRIALVALASLSALTGAARACDSTSCLLLTRGHNGVLARRAFRVDVSYRYTSQNTKYAGDDPTSEVVRPRVDFESGTLVPGYHRDLGEKQNYLQVDGGYGLTERLTLEASAPVMARHDADVEHFGLPVTYTTRGIGDCLAGFRFAVARGLTAAAAIKLPTGESEALSPFGNEGIIDPTLQAGTGSFDFVLGAQYVIPARPLGLALTLAGSHQFNTTNQLDYRFGDDSIAALGASHKLKGNLDASVQLKGFHKGRNEFLGAGVPSTGSTIVYLTPGLRVNATPSMAVYGLVLAPLYRNVNEAQLVPSYSFVLGFSSSILPKEKR